MAARLGPDGAQKVQPITDKVADLQMYIERAGQALLTREHSLKSQPEPMDTQQAVQVCINLGVRSGIDI